MSLIPPYLKPGDVVAVAAPARKISEDELRPAIRLFESWGLRVLVPDGLYAECGQLAGNDAHRMALMQRLLDDPEVNAICCARGGYGSVRIVDGLDWTRFREHPKWMVGYSDVTVLHSHIQRQLGIATLHATMPVNIPEDACQREYPATESLRKALMGEKLSYRMQCYAKPRTGAAVEGEIVGGNLSILYSLCGSESDIDTTGKILLVEDLDEYLYHIDRMMQNLRRTGKLSKIKALVVGAMSDMHDNTIPFGKDAVEIVREAAREGDFPIVFTNEIGHVGMENRAIPLGTRCRLSLDGEDGFTLEF